MAVLDLNAIYSYLIEASGGLHVEVKLRLDSGLVVDVEGRGCSQTKMGLLAKVPKLHST